MAAHDGVQVFRNEIRPTTVTFAVLGAVLTALAIYPAVVAGDRVPAVATALLLAAGLPWLFAAWRLPRAGVILSGTTVRYVGMVADTSFEVTEIVRIDAPPTSGGVRFPRFHLRDGRRVPVIYVINLSSGDTAQRMVDALRDAGGDFEIDGLPGVT